MTKNTSLAQIARKLTALEKNDVKSAIEKGRLLKEAREQRRGSDLCGVARKRRLVRTEREAAPQNS
jgi:hypothetical protein